LQKFLACWGRPKDVIPAYGVEGEGLAVPVVGVPEQAEGLLLVPKRIGVMALVLGNPSQGVASEGLPGAVAELLVQPQACREVAMSLLIVRQPDACGGDGPAGRGLPGEVT
jgi:hypothetical protein